jgi:hypothetical protein
MSDPLESLHLKLPYLAPSQAQKHVTHNEALRKLDALVQLAVLDSNLTEPPAEPEDGNRHIVGVGATGAWAGKDGTVASYVDGAWDHASPEAGWIAFEIAAEVILVHRDGEWQALAASLGNPELFGVNATPDETNRLAVRSNAVLFSNVEDTEGGTGDIRFVVNKEADADTASLLFQTDFSARAEIGLVGDNDFVFKISPDGSAWTEAIRIDKDTGLPTILYDNATSGLVATTMQDAIDEVAAGGGGGGGAVVSVFGRTGAVAAAASDYDASQVDNDSAVSGATVTNALETLGAAVAGKQDSDPDLIALAGVSSTGLLARTGAGTAAARSLVAGDGLTGSNFDGVAGNPTLDVGAGTGILANADDVAIDKASDANVRSAASNKVLTADLIESASAPVTLTDGASPSFDWDAGINREWTAAANRTCPSPTNVQIGTQRTILFKGNSGTTRTIGFGANFKGSLPTIEVTDTSWFLATFHAIAADHIVVGGRVAAP